MRRRGFANAFTVQSLAKKYHFRLLVISVLAMLGALFYIVQMLREMAGRVSVAVSDEVAAEYLYEALNHTLVVVVLSFVIFLLFFVLFVLFIEHKVSGPTVAILKFIDELKNENYEYARNLRDGDELGEIMAALKDLQKSLKSQRKSRSKSSEKAED